MPAPRGWALAAHTLPVHVLRSALPRAGGWGWNSSGKVPFLCSLPSFSWISSVQPLGLIQRQGWEGSQVTSPLLTKTETEAQAGEMTSSRSCGQLGMEVERELELADCQLIFFPERKLGSGILGQGGRSRWAMSFSSPNPDGVELYSGPSCSSPLPPGFPQI